MRQRLSSMAAYLQHIVVMSLVLTCTFANAQELEQTIFGATEKARADAEAANVILLSPKAYRRGVEELERAERDFEKGKNLERIKERLADASSFFQKAISNADIARVTLPDAIESRVAANAAEAYRLAPRDWVEAEKLFNDAALALEDRDDGQVQTARPGRARQSVLAERYGDLGNARLVAALPFGVLRQVAPHQRLGGARAQGTATPRLRRLARLSTGGADR